MMFGKQLATGWPDEEVHNSFTTHILDTTESPKQGLHHVAMTIFIDSSIPGGGMERGTSSQGRTLA